MFLGDHILSGLWLPAGGHVEPGEDPAVTARREELGFAADVPAAGCPVFLTMTETAGPNRHTDVSLWYLLTGNRSLPITLDRREFAAGRWWSAAEIQSSVPACFDPHLGRFLAKVNSTLG